MVSIVVVDRQDLGIAERIIADVTFDSSYPHGGEEILASSLGFRVGKLTYIHPGASGNFRTEYAADPALAEGGGSGGAARASRNDRARLIVRRIVGIRQDFLLNAPGLAIGTSSAAEVKIVNPVVYVAGGAVVEDAAATEVAFTATTHDITNDADKGQEAYYTLSSVDGINLVITKGSTADEGVAVPPAAPANSAILGFIKILVEAGAVIFNATTDLLSAAHLTVTFEDSDGQVYQAEDLSALTVRVVAEGR